jgi:hypothetical protein
MQAGARHSQSPTKAGGNAVIVHLTPVMSSRRLNSQPGIARVDANSRKNNGPRRGSAGAVGVVCVGGIDADLKRNQRDRSRIFWASAASISRNQNNGCHEQGRDQRKRLIQGFRSRLDRGGFEWRHHTARTISTARGTCSSRPCRIFQVGGFNSPASQPRAPDVMGSFDTTVV